MLAPLLDRIEVINVPAYLPIEKLNIGKQYLLPALEEEYGFQNEKAEVIETAETVLEKEVKQGTTAALERVSLTDAAIMEVITHYCGHEAGVRNLKKCLDRVFRKVTAKLEAQEAEIVQESGVTEYQINTQNLERFLDVAPSDDNFYVDINKQLPIGSSNGLAYVNDGYGAVLKIQFIKKMFGQKETKDGAENASMGTFTHTGRLGETMTEST